MIARRGCNAKKRHRDPKNGSKYRWYFGGVARSRIGSNFLLLPAQRWMGGLHTFASASLIVLKRAGLWRYDARANHLGGVFPTFGNSFLPVNNPPAKPIIAKKIFERTSTGILFAA